MKERTKVSAPRHWLTLMRKLKRIRNEHPEWSNATEFAERFIGICLMIGAFPWIELEHYGLDITVDLLAPPEASEEEWLAVTFDRDGSHIIEYLYDTGAVPIATTTRSVALPSGEELEHFLRGGWRPRPSDRPVAPRSPVAAEVVVSRRPPLNATKAESIDEVPIIAISRDLAAMLSLSPCDHVPGPATSFRVRIAPNLARLSGLKVDGEIVTPEWEGPAPAHDLSRALESIAWGACRLLSESNSTGMPQQRLNGEPLKKRPAYARQSINVRIKSPISEAWVKLAESVISGTLEYANALQESVSVRGHFATYYCGPGRQRKETRFRRPHSRGPIESATKQRTYVLTG